MNNKKVSCVAKNNDINDPKTRTVTIQMNCEFLALFSAIIALMMVWTFYDDLYLVRPQSVKILRKQNFLTEGVKVQIICEVRNL